MDINSISSTPEYNQINSLEEFFLPLYYPLEKYGYVLKNAINNSNRWHTKIVCTITDKYGKDYVSTTYTESEDYLKLIKTIDLLEANNKLLPKIKVSYPQDNSIVCNHIGRYLHDYFIIHSSNVNSIVKSIFNYLEDLNTVEQNYKPFIIPEIVNDVIATKSNLNENYSFFKKIKDILPELEKSKICFTYGCGIQDPHIWNFRVLENGSKIQSFTTDYDYFTTGVNCFWELGYFYATLRWIREKYYSIACDTEEAILLLIKDKNLKSLFMFWLGVLSSYCGYRDSINNYIERCGLYKLEKQISFIEELDNRVSFLAKKILEDKYK